MIPVDKKFALNVAEAAEYFSIGQKKIRQIANDNPNARFVLWVGSKLLIKRTEFEKFLSTTNAI